MPTGAPRRGPASGAGGGTGRGPVRLGDDPPDGAVLRCGCARPGAWPPSSARLAGLVAETGSPLSHLAILARERGVPVVVGYRGARAQLDGRARWCTSTAPPGGSTPSPERPLQRPRTTDEATREVPPMNARRRGGGRGW